MKLFIYCLSLPLKCPLKSGIMSPLFNNLSLMLSSFIWFNKYFLKEWTNQWRSEGLETPGAGLLPEPGKWLLRLVPTERSEAQISADVDFRLSWRGLSMPRPLGVPQDITVCVSKLGDSKSVQLQGIQIDSAVKRETDTVLLSQVTNQWLDAIKGAEFGLK